MEDYDKFVQLCLSQLRKNEEEEQKHSKPLSASVIRFCGRPILPPLLSEKQREEMRRHRDEMQKATVHKKFSGDPRMARVQTILHSVQLRKTPTLEELLEESEIRNEFLHPRNISKASHSEVNVGTMETLPPASGVFTPSKTSTTYSAFCPDVSPQQSCHEECLNEQRDSQQESQPGSFSSEIHPSPSSGYITNENPENTVSISEWTEGFFLQNTSNTIAKMPDIISHPPIDGEELERSGLESVFLQVKDIDDASFHNDSLTRDPQNNEQFEISHLESVEHEEHIPFSTKPDFSDYVNMEKNEGLVTLPDKTVFSDNLNLSQKSFKPPSLTSEPQKKPSEAEPEPVNQINKLSTKQSEELHPMSLQALLKKSQEYRRRQRLLRNQAKNTKIQEKTQEQPKARIEEQSLSDKENEDKDTGTAEDKKTKEQRGNFIPSVEKNTAESEASEGRSKVKNESITQNGNTTELMSAEEETALKNKLNSFQEFITQPKESSSFIQQRPTSAGRYQDTFNRISCLKGSHRGVGKYCTVPVPNVCLSPVHFKSKDGPKDGLTVEEEKTSIENPVLNQAKALSSTANVMTGDDFTGVFAQSSLHIDQLRSSLSCLKVLISDLESTMKESLDNQTENSVQTESGFKSMKQSDQLEQRDCFGVEGEQSDDDDGGNNVDGRDLQRRQLIDFQTIHEDLESEASFIGTDDVCLSVQERALEFVKLNHDKICKTAATGGKEKCAKGFVQRDASTRQPFPTKSLTSVAQLMLVPDMFRNGLSENTLPWDTSILSDQSNRPELKEREATAEGQQRCVRSPSLNQSYDVEMPSGLWLLEGSGSDPGSQSHLGPEMHMTPDSGGEGHRGVSKVKRRLLMHLTDETQEKSASMSGAASAVVRPNSSTCRAAVHLYEDIKKDGQEQLKQAHATQVRALQDKHRKQQEELLQVLAARYRLLQNVSPRSTSGSCPGDTLTFSALSQPLRPLSRRCRPLLAAAVKGFLTRRLLRTERVAQLLRTIRDTQQFLQAQGAASREFCSRQDGLLQERVALQLRAARYEVHDIFFSLSAGEQMQLISWDRGLVKDRELRQQNGHSGSPRRKSFLSAATQKSLERKREMLIQKGAAELHKGVLTKTGQKSGFTAKKPQETKRGQFIANPQRVPKSRCSSRPR
ncbi:uncharacterized protein cp110 [Austrofundulus limnaeus]|uniref:Uncharacterized protein cp110 n=1 Tax=Austrofundulus limnaeus TaxID=52670 RepID=A0A2I4BNZ6_AUSLI|nr:PREDICTED: uncharacterized protein LOC106521453 [Austrofundulus limnaeus]